MTTFIFISAIVLGIIFRKSKACTMYILAVMFILAAFRTTSADYEAYNMSYDLLDRTSEFKYIGYAYFQKIFYYSGLNFKQYNYVFYLIVLCLLVIAIRILTLNVNSVLAYYMIFSYPLDAVQMRSFLSEVLSLVGIAIIIKFFVLDKPVKSNIKFGFISTVFLILSLLIHFSSAFNLIAVVIYLAVKNRKSMGKKLLFLAVLFSIFCYSGYFALVLDFAGSLGIIGSLEYFKIYAMRSGKFGFLLYCGWITILIFACRFNKKEICKESVQSKISDYILTSVLVFPLLIVNVECNRLIRIYMVLLYIFYSNIKRKRTMSPKMLLNYCMYFVSVFFPFSYIIGNLFVGTLGTLLNNNAILKW